MTDNKPIMIDGVDVNGCEYLYTDKYNDKCCRASIGGDALCKPSEMICFKYVEILRQQLARKTQECEYWKHQAELGSDTTDRFAKQLEVKDKELQEAMDNYVQLDLKRVKEYNKLVDLYNTKEQECDRYKQALKEVQRLVSNIINDKNFVGEGKLWQMVFDIEKIISKVENDG